MSLGLQIALEEVENNLVLRLEGRLDATTAPFLERKIQKLIDERHYRILLDFSHVDSVNSAALRFFLSLFKKLKAKKGILILFSLSEEVDKTIKMAGFDKILHICPNEKAALQFDK